MGKKIAKLIIEGVIQKENRTYNQKWLLNTIENLKARKNIIGLILYIDSPGGTVYEADEMYKAVLRYKEKTGKPVFAYFASLAASGGYYIGCSADKIIANRNTLTGSVGVISGRFADVSSLLERYGVKTETIHSGKNKTMGSPTVPLTDEQRAIMQSISDECYDQFVSIVSKSRNMEIDRVKELADGRLYTGKQAKENGLIDEIMDFDEVKSYFLKSVYGDKKVVAEIQEFKKREKKSLLQKLTNASALTEMIKPGIGFPSYYDDRFWK